jgi:hypothetical protein
VSRRRKRSKRRAVDPRPAPPPRSAREVLRAEVAEAGVLLSPQVLGKVAAPLLLLSVVLSCLTLAFAPWVGRWFAVVPRSALIVSVEDGNPVVLLGDGAAGPVRAVAHGSYTPGEPLEAAVRHVPFVPEAAVMADHLQWDLLVALAVLLCLSVLAVWAPRGLRASWRRRRRSHPRRGRVEGTELWVPVALRAGVAAALLLAGGTAGVFGHALGSVRTGWALAGPFSLACLAWLLLPAGAWLAVLALYRYAERASVRVRPPAHVRVLPRWAVHVLRAAALAIAFGSLFVAEVAQSTPALTVTGTAEVSAVWERTNRAGDCTQGRARVEYTAADLPYRTTLPLDCEDLPVLETAGEIPVRWAGTAPEHVVWAR